MSWTPHPEAVAQLQQILKATLSPDHAIREQATNALNEAKIQSDALNYLVYILVEDQTSTADIRASAGLNLKNSLYKKFRIEADSYLLQNILKGLFDNNVLVRNITGNVITTLFAILGVKGWPQVIPQLFELSESGSPQAQEGASSALSKICEDSNHILNAEISGTRPLDFMVPKFISLSESPLSSVRANALGSINHIIYLKSQSFIAHIDEFLTRLFALATDQDQKVHRNVCVAFANVLEIRPDKIAPHLDGVINYSIHTINEAEDEVALEACEFLLSLATSDIEDVRVKPYLPLIIPVLLKNMVYSESDLAFMDNDDDADEDDKDEDIRPTAAKTKNAHNEKDNEEEDDDDDLSTEWNIRKCSAATLDVFASGFPEETLDISLPILKENIVSQQWPLREGAILAFGAVADGGIEFASRQLPDLVPFLVDRLQDSEPRVRQITCWTLGRYSSWICSEAHKGGAYASYFIPTFQTVLACLLDKKKVVQEGACSSLAQFIESSSSDLIQPLAGSILEKLSTCFHVYKRKNLVILYDAIQTFVEKVEIDDNAIQQLLPPLIEKWGILDDNDKELWPLLECMSSVAASLGERFAPYAIEVYQRAVRILGHCIEVDKLSVTDPTINTLEKDFVITSLDLVDGLTQGLGEHSGDLIDDTLINLLIETFGDVNDDVRQSAYALLGDLAIYIPSKLGNHLQAIIGSIGFEISTSKFENFAVVNNATWALGEIALRLNLGDYLEKLTGLLIDLLNSQAEATVLENAAITIGRIGIVSPEFFAVHLPEFAGNWSKHVLYLEDNDEKETAFQGMVNIILTNPTGLTDQSLIDFMNTITMYAQPGQQLAELFFKLLSGYKELLGAENWSLLLQKIENAHELVQRYGL